MPGLLSASPYERGSSPDALDLARAALEVRQGLRGLEAQRLELGLVVVDADDLTGLGDAVEAAGLPGLAVGGEPVEVQQLGRVGGVPVVRLGVAVDRLEQPGLHEGAHVGVALVGLDDVGRVGGGQGQLQGGLQVGEGPGDALDGDVRVLLHERLVERLGRGVGAGVGVLVPHGEGDLAGLRGIGGDRTGVLVRAVARTAAGTGSAGRGGGETGGGECDGGVPAASATGARGRSSVVHRWFSRCW
jgi:hypothetical protein